MMKRSVGTRSLKYNLEDKVMNDDLLSLYQVASKLEHSSTPQVIPESVRDSSGNIMAIRDIQVEMLRAGSNFQFLND